MLGVKIDRNDPTLLHQQVAAEIRRAIAEGEAKSGERLPPARDLAAVLGVNTNTVLRALRELRDERLLKFRRGRGVTVARTPEQGAVIARAHELLGFARQHVYQPDELIRLIHDLAWAPADSGAATCASGGTSPCVTPRGPDLVRRNGGHTNDSSLYVLPIISGDGRFVGLDSDASLVACDKRASRTCSPATGCAR